MENKDTSAFPVIVPDGDYRQPGLTKREYFAAMALQGYVSAGSTGMPEPDQLAAYAVAAADALLAELDKANT